MNDPRVDRATEQLHQALDAAGFSVTAHQRVGAGPSKIQMNGHALVEALLRAGWTPPADNEEMP